MYTQGSVDYAQLKKGLPPFNLTEALESVWKDQDASPIQITINKIDGSTLTVDGFDARRVVKSLKVRVGQEEGADPFTVQLYDPRVESGEPLPDLIRVDSLLQVGLYGLDRVLELVLVIESEVCLSAGDGQFGLSCFRVAFVNSDLVVSPDMRHQLFGKGTNVMGPGKVDVPGWFGHGSHFRYNPSDDVWEECNFEKMGSASIWRRV
jgi:hypothetical protein